MRKEFVFRTGFQEMLAFLLVLVYFRRAVLFLLSYAYYNLWLYFKKTMCTNVVWLGFLLACFFFLSLLDISVLKYSLSLLSQNGDFNTILVFGATVYLNRSVYVIIGSH